MARNHFNPEICFETPVGRMCFPILSGPTFPYPPARATTPELENWAIVHSPHGEINRAASCSGSDELLFIAQAEKDDESSTKSFYLSRNGEVFLTYGGRAYRDRQAGKLQCAGKLSMFVKGDEIDYRMTISQETCTTARIIAESRGTVIERTVDFLSPKCTKNDSDMGLCRALGEHEQEKLRPFSDLLVAVSDYYWNRAREELALLPTLLKNPTEGGTQASLWCGLARVGCVALATAGAGLCCVGTAVVGCALCAGGFGAAGGVCTEAWNWC